MYLFAYIQKNTYSYRTDNQFKNDLNAALDYCKRQTGNSAGVNAHQDTRGRPPIRRRASAAANKDISSGTYTCDDGGVYYIRKIRNEVWWFGSNAAKTYSNVMRGRIEGDTIYAAWVDVLWGRTANSGSLALLINDRNTLSVVGRTGNIFPGTIWKLNTVTSDTAQPVRG